MGLPKTAPEVGISAATDAVASDPEWSAVVTAWPTLRPELRAAVLAMIGAATTSKP